MAGPDGVVEILELGLKASGLRGKAIASNIANLETPGYRRKQVRFEDALQKAIDCGRKDRLKNAAPELFEPQTNAPGSNGNDVILDQEIGELVKNSAKRKAYIRLLKRYYDQVDMAIGMGQ